MALLPSAMSTPCNVQINSDEEEPPSDLFFVEGADFHIDIPNNERRVQSPRQVQGSTFVRDEFVPDLNGRTREEVEREAARITLGQYFSDWNDFNRCMDSWGVLQGRRAERYASKPNFAVRTCRYGLTNRKNNKRTKQAGGSGVDADTMPHTDSRKGSKKAANSENKKRTKQTGGSGDDADTEAADSDFQRGSKTATSSFDLATSSEIENPTDDEFWNYEKYHTTVNSEPTQNLLSCQNVDVSQGKENIDNTSEQLITPDKTVTVACRQPLGDIQVNTLPNPLSLVRTEELERQSKDFRSVVYGAKAWLSTKRVGKEGRKISRTGACGELGRCPPPDADSESETEQTPCPFRVRAQREATSGKIYISKCNLKHTCARIGHKWRGPTHKAKWLGVTLAPAITRNPKVPIKELQTGFSMDHRKSCVYKQMWRAKDLVRDWYMGGQRASFHRIPYLLERIVQSDPSAICNWCTEDYKDIFKRAFICPSATRNALQYCQPMVCLDAAHTKNRKYPTQLFLATTMDGNGRVLILCYALAPVENKDNWVWFLEQMHRAIAGVDDANLLFMSDRQKGLLPAVREVFPGKVHAHCANHLRANVKKLFGKGAEDHFVACVYANTLERFDDLLMRLVESTTKGVAAAEYIRRIDTKLYARHAVQLARMGKVSSNPAEQANSGLLSIREYAPFKVLLELWYYMQSKQNIRRAEAGRSQDALTTPAHKRHEWNQRHFGQWQVAHDGALTAKVWSTAKKLDYLVKLEPRVTCTCFELQDMLWPCQHIMAWDDKVGRNYEKRFHRCWKTSSLIALHRVVRMEGGRSGGRQLTGDDVEIDSDGNFLLKYPIHDDPNTIEPMPTIHTISAREANHGMGGKKRKAGPLAGKRKCTLCGIPGHNRRSCAQRFKDSETNVHLADGAQVAVPVLVDVQAEVQQEPIFDDLLEEVPLTAGAPIPSQSIGQDDNILYPHSTSDEGENKRRGPENYELDSWQGDGGFVDLDYLENVASGVTFQFSGDEEGPTSDIVL